jgi:hypothetical protein
MCDDICDGYMSFLKEKKMLFFHLEVAKSLHLMAEGRLWNEFTRNFLDSFAESHDVESLVTGLFEVS